MANTSPSKVRVLIVDDSAFMRKVLETIFNADPQFQVAGHAKDGRDGAASTLKALELGAIEFIAKPSGAIDLDMQSIREDLLRKVKMAAKVRVVRTASRLAATLQSLPSAVPSVSRPAPFVSQSSQVADQRF